MVRLLLRMKADLENVQSIEFPDDYLWNIDVEESGGGERRSGVTLSRNEVFDIPNSRGTANLLIKFGGNAPAYINLETVKGVTRPYTAADSGEFVPVMSFECRGMQPVKWTPTPGCVVKGPKTEFCDVTLSEDWAEFDEVKSLTGSGPI